MTDNLILFCGIGFGLLLLCIAALVVWILVRKESANQAECAPTFIDAQNEIVRLKEVINQHDNEMAQVINAYESEIERLKELVKPQDAIEADFGLQLDDDDDDDLIHLPDDNDDDDDKNEEEDDEIKI